ncbi:MAG: anti-sigma factor family protein [Candidatus Zixiibacteriota bacterium]
MSDIDKFRELAAGYVDDELTPEEKREFETMMEEHPELREDVDAFRRINDLTGRARFEDLPDPIWEAHRASLYRRAESALRRILLSVGAIILLAFGGWAWWGEFFMNSSEPLIVRLAVGALALGGIVLLVAKLRETLFARKRERYGKVQKWVRKMSSW